MSTIDRLDLTAAVEAAARATAERQNGPGSWDGLDGYAKYMWRDGVLATVTAAAPLIAQQVAEQIAQAIERERREYGSIIGSQHSARGGGILYGLDWAADTAREWGEQQ
jgi:hypothetical protein